MQKQAALRFGKETLEIPYPLGFKGKKSLDPQDNEIYINSAYRWLTEDEIPLVQAKIAGIGYRQELKFSGAILIDDDDPLLSLTADELDAIETNEQLQSTKYAKDGGLRQVRDRVLILRELGYQGVGRKQLGAGV